MTSQATPLRSALSGPRPVAIVEYVPPASMNAEAVRVAAVSLRGKIHAAGVQDNRSEVRMSAIAAAALLGAEGVEPIVHMTTRDRNRIALLSDVLGAQALGLRNFLCTSGDHQTLGRERSARNVYDLDSIQFLGVLDQLRRDGILFGDGRKVGPCDLFLGAVASLWADPQQLQAMRVAKKVRAGADFLVTQPVFDVDGFARWLEALQPYGIVGKVPIVVGILAPPSADKAREINERTPGVRIPEAVIKRLGDVPPDRQKAEAAAIAVELVEHLKRLDGVKGFCLTTEGDVDLALDIVRQCNLTPTS